MTKQSQFKKKNWGIFFPFEFLGSEFTDSVFRKSPVRPMKTGRSCWEENPRTLARGREIDLFGGEKAPLTEITEGKNLSGTQGRRTYLLSGGRASDGKRGPTEEENPGSLSGGGANTEEKNINRPNSIKTTVPH